MFMQMFNTQAQSLLMMTSVAMPVFSKKEETVSFILFFLSPPLYIYGHIGT